MHTSEALARLHRLLHSLENARSRVEQGPKRIRRKDKLVAEAEAAIEAAKAETLRLKKMADEKTLQLKTGEAKLADLQGKLNAAKTNREFTILKEQIEADTAAGEVLEVEILEVLEKIDLSEQSIKDAETARDEAIAAREKTRQTVENKLPELQAEIDELEKEIVEAEAVIPANVKGDYVRMKAVHGAATLSEVQNNACTNCYVSLAPQTRVELRGGKTVVCRSCQRILFLPPSD